MAFCSSCGAQHSAGAVYCDECGAMLRTGAAAAEPMSSASAPRAAYETMGSSALRAAVLGGTAAAAAPARTAIESIEVDVQPLLKRYGDAYDVARGIIAHGTATKVLGWILAGILFFAGLLLLGTFSIPQAQASLPPPLPGMIVSFVVAFVVGYRIHGVGAAECARGQMLLASLDCAVHGSPFLSNTIRAKVMSLPLLSKEH